MTELRHGTPSIELNPSTGSTRDSAGIPADGNTIVVGVWMLQPGEDLIVARRLLKCYRRPAARDFPSGHIGIGGSLVFSGFLAGICSGMEASCGTCGFGW